MSSNNQQQQAQVQGTVVETTENQKQEKQGSKYFGFCCDFRNTVVILSISAIVFYTVLTIATEIEIRTDTWEDIDMEHGKNYTSPATEWMHDLDPSDINPATEWIPNLLFFRVSFITSLVLGILQLIGALTYNVCILSTSLFFVLCNLSWAIYMSWFDALRVTQVMVSLVLKIVLEVAFTFYPVAGLIRDIRSGAMTKETETYSCSGKPKVEDMV